MRRLTDDDVEAVAIRDGASFARPIEPCDTRLARPRKQAEPTMSPAESAGVRVGVRMAKFARGSNPRNSVNHAYRVNTQYKANMLSIINIDKFKTVAPQMLWRNAATSQIDAFEHAIAAFATRFRATAEVVGSHRSKSIDLPVVKVSTDIGDFTMRDNFHDINLMAVLRSPSTLMLEQLFAGIQEPLTWEWYLAEIERARSYSWREWSDEEMNDPCILRVRDKRPDCDMWWEKKGDEKDRWAARMSSPAWYSRDWSSAEFAWDGDFGPGVKLYRQGHAYAEGINSTTSNRRYLKGVSDFIIALDALASAIAMIERFHITQHRRAG